MSHSFVFFQAIAYTRSFPSEKGKLVEFQIRWYGQVSSEAVLSVFSFSLFLFSSHIASLIPLTGWGDLKG